MTTAKGNLARVVQGCAQYKSEQGSLYTPAVCAETVGAKSLFFGVVTIPPGERTKAHVHQFHESAFYILSGEDIELWSGDQLQFHEVARAGDYLFIPANTPHVAVNRGATAAVFVGARNEPTAQESVLMRPELDERVP